VSFPDPLISDVSLNLLGIIHHNPLTSLQTRNLHITLDISEA